MTASARSEIVKKVVPQKGKSVKKLILLLSIIPTLAIAQEAPPAKVSCGSTVEECQKILDLANEKLQNTMKQITVYQQLLSEANARLAQQASK